MNNSNPTKSEAPAAIYEKLYAEGDETYENPKSSPYYPLFLAAVDALDACGARNVLEVGCGSGTLGQMVISKSIDYRGFDYAHTGVEKALRRNPKREASRGVTPRPTRPMLNPTIQSFAARSLNTSPATWKS